MTDYYERLAAADKQRHEQERQTARALIISVAPEPDREEFLNALGLTEA